MADKLEWTELTSAFLFDIRGPVTNIHSALEYGLENFQADPETARKAFEMAFGASSKLLLLMADYLVIYRTRMEHPSQVADMDAFLDRCLFKFQNYTQTAPISIEKSITQHLPQITLNSEAAAEVLSRCIDVALGYVPDSGHIHLTVEIQADEIMFKVIDNGGAVTRKEGTSGNFFLQRSGVRLRTMDLFWIDYGFISPILTFANGRLWVENTADETCVAFALPILELEHT